ncbi:MAG: AI-2E family transporter [Saprospiraceae bacterium]|nr:AI-2E family transporter [Saprospiraceae bacterium]
MAKKRTSQSIDLRYLLAIIPLLVVGWLLYLFSDIVTYVLIGWVISMIGAPVVVFLRKYLGKNLAAGITLFGFILVLVILMWIFIPPISKQARQLAGIDYTELIKNLEEPIGDWEKWMEEKGLIDLEQEAAPKETEAENEKFVYTALVDIDSLLSEKYNEDTLVRNENITLLIKIDGTNLNENQNINGEDSDRITFFEQAKNNLYSFFNPSLIPKFFTSVVGTLGSFIVGLMSVFFIAFFFLREQGLFNTMISGVVPDKHDRKVIQAINESSTMLIRYFIGVLSQVTIITIFVTIALSILGVKNALLIGFFAALMNIIPYIGPIIGAIFAAVITISSNIGMPFYPVEGIEQTTLLPLLIKVFIVFGTMQMLDNFILQPNIFSKSVKAHPLEIFLIVLIGANIGGILGMVLAIPAYTVVRVIAKVFLSEFKVVQSLTKGL